MMVFSNVIKSLIWLIWHWVLPLWCAWLCKVRKSEIAAQLQHAVARESEQDIGFLPQGLVSKADLVFLLGSLGRLHSGVDRIIHNLGFCTISKMGHRGMRDSINHEIEDNNSFLDTQLDRDYYLALHLHWEIKLPSDCCTCQGSKVTGTWASFSWILPDGEDRAVVACLLLLSCLIKKLRNSRNWKQAKHP